MADEDFGLVVNGDLPKAATRRIAAAVAESHAAAGDLKVRLSQEAGLVIAQADAVVAGQLVRVQVACAGYREVVKALEARLRRRLAEAAEPWSPRPWLTGDDTEAPVPYGTGLLPGFIVRDKTRTPARCEPEAAAAVLDALDYRAYLFTDAGTGEDAVIYRGGPTGYRLARLRLGPPPRPNGVPLATDPRPAPMLTRQAATERLDDIGLGHLFYADTDTGRGRLLYRRFDGHYGLIGDAS